MAGIYIHIPFCRKACHYCDFHFSTSAKYRDRMVISIIREIEERKYYLNEKVSTIYFGGGTPSVLPVTELKKILDAVYLNFEISNDPEITLEANPEDLTPDYLTALSQIPVNRLSIGIQSFRDEHLEWMNRAHTGQQALDAVRNAKAAGFNNITIDLIYGFEALSDDEWKENLESLRKENIPHFSSYCLTIEPGTVFGHQLKKGQIKLPEEKGERHFRILQQFCIDNGYEQYEISNFCRDKTYSRHNSSYWSGASYLGIGPGAHSFNGTERCWNVRNNAVYMNNIEKGISFSEAEILSPENRFNEKVMVGLRTAKGILKNQFSESEWKGLLFGAVQWEEKGWLKISAENISLTPEGMLFADFVSSELFI